MKQKKPGKLLSLLLALVMVVGMLPLTSAFAVGSGSDKAIMPGTTGISDPQKITQSEGKYYYAPSDYIYFGDGAHTRVPGAVDGPIKWRVLDADRTNDGNKGMFLLSENLFNGIGPSFEKPQQGKHVDWQGSEEQKWCKAFSGEKELYNQNSAFSDAEKSALLAVTKDDSAGKFFNIDFASSKLKNEKVFCLSVKEVVDYMANCDSPNLAVKNPHTDYQPWRLRSPDDYKTKVGSGVYYKHVGSVRADGHVYSVECDNSYVDSYARPAFNLNLNSVLFTSAAKNGKQDTIGLKPVQDYSGNEWKITLKDETHTNSGFTASESTPGKIKYSGAVVGANEYISVLIQDNKTMGYTHYGRIGQVKSESGEFSIDLKGIDMEGKTLYVFNEQCNGDYKTDYAGELLECEVSVPLPEVINSVSVNGIVPPVTGQLPSTAATVPEDANYTVKSVTWYESSKTSPTTTEFKNNTQYYVSIRVEPKPGYELASKSKLGSNNSINGKHATYHDGDKTFAEFRYTFPTTDSSKISYVSVSGIKLPVAGEQPNTNFTIPDGANYVKDPETGSGYVIWTNAETGKEQTSTFEPGIAYKATVFLDAKEGYTFVSKEVLTAQMNGNPASVDMRHDNFVKISYTFPKLEAPISTVGSIEAAIDRPVIGENTVKVTVDSGKPYSGQVMAWSVGDDYATAAGLFGNFEAGKTYWANIKFDIKDTASHKFANSLDTSGITGSDGVEKCIVSSDGSYAEVVVKFVIPPADVLTFTQQPVDVTGKVDESLQYTFTVDKTPTYCVLEKKVDGEFVHWNAISGVSANNSQTEYISSPKNQPITETYHIEAVYNGTYYYSNEFTATWTTYATEQASYTVKHMQEKLDALGTYEEVTADTQTLNGNVGENTTAAAKEYSGFVSQPITQKEIAEDGSTVVEIKYDRKRAIFHFDANGGVGSMSDFVQAFGETMQLPANTFTRTGYKFVYWTENADGTGYKWSDQTQMTHDNSELENNTEFTMYAKWEDEETPVTSATVTFKIVNGTWDGKDSKDKTVTVTLTDGKGTLNSADVPTGMKPDSGYTGGAWNMTPATEVTGDVTYTYAFEKKSSGGGGGGSYIAPTYSITIEGTKNGTVTCSDKQASRNETVTLTVKPDEGYQLSALTVTDSKGKELTLTEKHGRFTFKMPASGVWVEASFQKEVSFIDVPADAYYADAVSWAVRNGITAGVSAETFAPDAACTRAQAVTFLWRAAGSPEPISKQNRFEDISADAYYADAVLWAVENGITEGTGDATFSPDAFCTRAQIVTFLWRSLRKPVVTGQNPFTDVTASAYYEDAVLWAVENGITNGTGKTTFTPDNPCTRAQIVTFLYRALNK